MELFESYPHWLIAMISDDGGPTKYRELLEWVNTDTRDDTEPMVLTLSRIL